jgi:hypothetical protein
MHTATEQTFTRIPDTIVHGKPWSVKVHSLYKGSIAGCATTCNSVPDCGAFVHHRDSRKNIYVTYAFCTFFKAAGLTNWADHRQKDTYIRPSAVPANLTSLLFDRRIARHAGPVREQRWRLWRGPHGDATMTLLMDLLSQRRHVELFDAARHPAWEFDPYYRYTGPRCEVVCPGPKDPPRQLVNPCPATRSLSCKRLFCRNLGGQQWATKCFEWPAQKDKVAQLAALEGAGSTAREAAAGVWFVRRQSHGRGFVEASSLGALLPRLHEMAARSNGAPTLGRGDDPLTETLLLSRRVEPPLLLRNRKVQARMFVLVTSYKPLRIFGFPVYRVNLAAAPYTNSSAEASNVCVHDPQRHMRPECESALFKGAADPVAAGEQPEEQPLSAKDLSWSGSRFEEELAKELVTRGGNRGGNGGGDGNDGLSAARASVRTLVSSTKDAIVSALALSGGSIASEAAQRCSTHRPCFGLWGFDVLWDVSLRPYLVEANETPLLIRGMFSKADAHAEALLTTALNDSLALLGADPLPRHAYRAAWGERVRRRCPVPARCDDAALDKLLALEDEVQHRRSLELLYPTPGRVREHSDVGDHVGGELPVDDFGAWVEELLQAARGST